MGSRRRSNGSGGDDTAPPELQASNGIVVAKALALEAEENERRDEQRNSNPGRRILNGRWTGLMVSCGGYRMEGMERIWDAGDHDS